LLTLNLAVDRRGEFGIGGAEIVAEKTGGAWGQ
jgi:hypothetical protein